MTTASKIALLSKTASLESGALHYLTAGSGPAVILLHGFTQTSAMWKPLIPSLAERFTVVAPDLPGIGDSSIPNEGLDMKTAAVRIHALAASLGLGKVAAVGHDIGLMVAYAYAAMYANEVEKLVLMDAFFPGVAGWEQIYNDPRMWHFRFAGETPEALVAGRERTYFEFFWNDLAADKAKSLPEELRELYTAAYARPGRMHASWEYFVAFSQTARDFAEFSKTQLSMPVLSIAGDKASAAVQNPQAKLIATNATIVELKNSGHWLMEEQPKETMAALLKFL